MEQKSKSTVRVITTKDRCPQCNGFTLEVDREGDIHCWSCSKTFIGGKVEGKPHGEMIAERHQFYEKNKTAILNDVTIFGGKEAARKWDISWGSLYHVLRRWGYEPRDVADPPKPETVAVEELDKSTQTKQVDKSRGETDHNKREFDRIVDPPLPALPAFSECFSYSVQIKWLEVYERVVERIIIYCERCNHISEEQ